MIMMCDNVGSCCVFALFIVLAPAPNTIPNDNEANHNDNDDADDAADNNY